MIDLNLPQLFVCVLVLRPQISCGISNWVYRVRSAKKSHEKVASSSSQKNVPRVVLCQDKRCTQITTGAFVVTRCGRGSAGVIWLTFGIFFAGFSGVSTGRLFPETAFSRLNFFCCWSAIVETRREATKIRAETATYDKTRRIHARESIHTSFFLQQITRK